MILLEERYTPAAAKESQCRDKVYTLSTSTGYCAKYMLTVPIHKKRSESQPEIGATISGKAESVLFIDYMPSPMLQDVCRFFTPPLS